MTSAVEILPVAHTHEPPETWLILKLMSDYDDNDCGLLSVPMLPIVKDNENWLLVFKHNVTRGFLDLGSKHKTSLPEGRRSWTPWSNVRKLHWRSILASNTNQLVSVAVLSWDRGLESHSRHWFVLVSLLCCVGTDLATGCTRPRNPAKYTQTVWKPHVCQTS